MLLWMQLWPSTDAGQDAERIGSALDLIQLPEQAPNLHPVHLCGHCNQATAPCLSHAPTWLGMSPILSGIHT